MAVDRRKFLLRRLHSLSGVFPIGAYLAFHLLIANAQVIGGPAAFDKAVESIAGVPAPMLLGIEILFIYLPLLFHGLYGFVRAREGSVENALHQDWLTSYLYGLQRLTGIVAFFFIAYHAWTTRGQHYFSAYLTGVQAHIGFEYMQQQLASSLRLAWYVVGTACAIFHFANGLWTFCVTWGITVSERSQRAARFASAAVGVLMAVTAGAIFAAFRA